MNHLLTIVLVFGLASLVFSGDDDGKCLFYDICEFSPLGPVPCVQNRPHHQYEDTHDTLQILKEDCPELFTDDTTIPEVCCSPEDVIRMQMSFEIYATPYLNCPSCYDNIKRLVCHAICAPNQNQFMSIVKTEKKSNGTVIRELNYYMSEKFVKGWRESCKKTPAYKELLKDGGCDESCGVEDFIKIAGTVGVRLPFQTNLIMMKEGQVPTVNGKPGIAADIPAGMCVSNCDPDLCPAVATA